MQLNHTIVWCRDKARSSAFLADILGRRPPRAFMHFGAYFEDPDGHLLEIITRPYADS